MEMSKFITENGTMNINSMNNHQTNNLYNDINQGWLVLKLVEIIIIPYCYLLLRPNKVAQLLFYASPINIFHNAIAFISIYLNNIEYTFDNENQMIQTLWYIQAICAASTRSLEICVNYLITGSLGTKSEKQIMLIFSILGILGIFIGKIIDVYETNGLNLRLGWLVSISCIPSSTFGLFILRKTLISIDNQSLSYQIISNTSFRIFFIQLIDIGLIINYSFGKSSFYMLPLFTWILVNLDNSRSLFQLLDIIFPKIAKSIILEKSNRRELLSLMKY
jgi:hypothetical protein